MPGEEDKDKVDVARESSYCSALDRLQTCSAFSIFCRSSGVNKQICDMLGTGMEIMPGYCCFDDFIRKFNLLRPILLNSHREKCGK